MHSRSNCNTAFFVTAHLSVVKSVYIVLSSKGKLLFLKNLIINNIIEIWFHYGDGTDAWIQCQLIDFIASWCSFIPRYSWWLDLSTNNADNFLLYSFLKEVSPWFARRLTKMGKADQKKTTQRADSRKYCSSQSLYFLKPCNVVVN